MTEYLTPNTRLPQYLMFPRFLLDSGLPETAKILYTVLLDRSRLSMKNKGWTDENGHVFLYFTISNMAAALHKSEMTIKNCLNELEKAGLITRQRQGAGQPNRLYVKLPKDSNLSPGQTENFPVDGQNVPVQRDKKVSANKNQRSNNHSANTGSKATTCYGSFQNVFLSDGELEELRKTVPGYERYIEKLSSYMASTGKCYQNHAATIKSWAMQDKPLLPKRTYECKEDESL